MKTWGGAAQRENNYGWWRRCRHSTGKCRFNDQRWSSSTELTPLQNITRHNCSRWVVQATTKRSQMYCSYDAVCDTCKELKWIPILKHFGNVILKILIRMQTICEDKINEATLFVVIAISLCKRKLILTSTTQSIWRNTLCTWLVQRYLMKLCRHTIWIINALYVESRCRQLTTINPCYGQSSLLFAIPYACHS